MNATIVPYAVNRPRTSAAGTVARLRAMVLGVPLLWKLLGANLLLVAAMLAAHYALPGTSTVVELVALLLASFAASGLLAWVALRPVTALEATAQRVSAGDFAARAPRSPLADQEMLRLSDTLNRLLDRVEADRARIHYLAGRSVRARDIERESVARELRESFAQTLAGVGMQLSAAGAASTAAPVREIIAQTRSTIELLTDEMRSVAETLYPGTLQEFGLVNAIDALARRVTRRSGIRVEVDAGLYTARIEPRAASALYRVAEEALRNVEQHAMARSARVVLRSNGHVVLDIEDDGRGMDMRASDPLHSGLGLFSARTVLALTGGEIQISSGIDRGTKVTARVPVAAVTPLPTTTDAI
jgi:two-component system sensor histidine kinase UhpB